MNYELDGVCVHCTRATPISENTLRPEGVVCSFCRETKPSAGEHGWASSAADDLEAFSQVILEEKDLSAPGHIHKLDGPSSKTRRVDRPLDMSHPAVPGVLCASGLSREVLQDLECQSGVFLVDKD